MSNGEVWQPPGLSFRAKTGADAERVMVAVNAFGRCLIGDLRTTEAYATWKRETGLAAAIAAVRSATDVDAADAARAELLLVFAGAVTMVHAHAAPALVVREFRLPYPWLSTFIASSFQQLAITETVGGAGVFGLVLSTAPPATGRRAKKGGDSLRQGAEWLYRAKVKNPPDSIRQLAREYAATVPSNRKKPRKSDGRGVVQAAIARVEDMFDQFEYVYAPLPK